MPVDEHREAAGRPGFGFAILTVSDSRDESSDRGGPLIARAVEEAGHVVAVRRIVRDEVEEIGGAAKAALADAAVDVVLVTGGTGVSARDVTPEAIRPLFEKELPGFGELFRVLSHQRIGAAAMLSRAAAGVASGKAIFLLPGSPAALELAMSALVLPELAHLLAQARRR
ncbi:MAG TPA: MogA/MoaB family molybdenum cofactor biosynthesis protein [Thermoanaerobaculia bacterium]|nr:MogA/MoaB family molybdenum cofactor biosynthesis protein [Thermoanaerobaculia bacterium]